MRSNQGHASFTHLARREQMIQATIETVAETGLQHASLAKVADRLGIAKGGIIYHFGGRDQLIEASLNDVYERIGQAIADHMGEAVSSRDGVHRYITALVRYLDEHRMEVRLIAEAFTLPEKPQKADDQVENRWRILAELMDAAIAEQARSASTALDTQVLAISVSGAIDALTGQALRDPAFDLRQAGVTLADHIDRLIIDLRPEQDDGKENT